MATVVQGISFLLTLYFLMLLARIVVSFVASMSHDFKPHGAGLVVVESILTVTDPPVRAVRAVVPPVPVGSVRFDLAVPILLLAIVLIQRGLTLIPV